jgi:hypothetical protein
METPRKLACLKVSYFTPTHDKKNDYWNKLRRQFYLLGLAGKYYGINGEDHLLIEITTLFLKNHPNGKIIITNHNVQLKKLIGENYPTTMEEVLCTKDHGEEECNCVLKVESDYDDSDDYH